MEYNSYVSKGKPTVCVNFIIKIHKTLFKYVVAERFEVFWEKLSNLKNGVCEESAPNLFWRGDNCPPSCQQANCHRMRFHHVVAEKHRKLQQNRAIMDRKNNYMELNMTLCILCYFVHLIPQFQIDLEPTKPSIWTYSTGTPPGWYRKVAILDSERESRDVWGN